MKKIYLLLGIVFCTLIINSQTRSVSKSFIIKPAEEKVKTVPEILLVNPVLPENGVINVTSENIIIQGSISDQNEIVSFNINNRQIVLSGNNEFNEEYRLSVGENTFLLKVINNSDGIVEREFTIIYTPDYSVPVITLDNNDLQNGNDLTIFTDHFLLEGMINDSYGIRLLKINNEEIQILTDGRFSKNIVLNEGENTITIEALNTREKTAGKKITILSSILPPVITITLPELPENNRVLFEGNEISVKGKVTGNIPVKSVMINNDNLVPERDGTFSTRVTLADGENKITIEAVNEKNKIARKQFFVITRLKISIPEIILAEPILTESREITTDDKYVKIKGTVRDETGIKEILIKQNSKVMERSIINDFEVFIEPGEGVNLISIEAKNNQEQITKSNFTIIQPVDKQGPVITILEPSVTRGIQVIHKNEILHVKGKVVDESGIFKVTVNGITANLIPGGEFSVDLVLKMGSNELTVQAFDNRYNMSSDTFYVVRELDDLVVGKYYALIIGINSYSGYWKPLGNAVNDAQAVAEILQEYYKIDEVVTLYDKEATEDNIIESLLNIGSGMTQDDNLLIYYAGHGYLDDVTNRGYWVPADAKINLISKYISNSDLRDIIAGLQSKHTLLITDACFAGDIFRGLTTSSIEKDPNDMNKYYRQVYSKPSRIAMTSGGVEPVMDGGKDGHSVFTYYLLKSLKENNKKYMDVEQLYNEFKVAVTNNSNQSPRLDRIKNTSDEGGQFIFIKK